MDYQTLSDILGQSKAGATPAPSLNSIIEGIQSQYQAVPSMPVHSGLYGANRFVSNAPRFGVIEKMPEYGALHQAAGPTFVPSAFDINTYRNIDDKQLSSLISQIGGSDGGSSGSNSGFAVDDVGLATSGTVTPGMVQAAGVALGLMGIPGSSLLGWGKNAIAQALTQAGYNSAVANNIAMVASTMGLNPADPANSAAISSAIDYLSAHNAQTTSATPGVAGTGGVASAAAQSAAANAAAAGHSDAAIGAASQAAANAAMSGATQSQADAAGAVAASAVDSAQGTQGTTSAMSGGFGFGDPSQSYGGGDTTSASSADSTASDNSGVGGW